MDSICTGPIIEALNSYFVSQSQDMYFGSYVQYVQLSL